MKEDWKDALNSLRGNFEETEDLCDNPQTIEITNDVTEYSQKKPLAIIVDKKGRNGKIATIIEGFEIPQKEVEEIARKLKQSLGVGGSVRNGEILIQGDHKDKIKSFLSALNFKIK